MKKNRTPWYIRLLVGFLVFIGLKMILSNSSSSNEVATSIQPKAAAPIELKLPTSQSKFIKVISEFIPLYKAAPNELKKSSLRKKRKSALKSAFPSLVVRNWTGTLKQMRTNSDGDANIIIQLAGSNGTITLQTDTPIALDSRLYKIISELEENDDVVFSGSLVEGLELIGDYDYIRETSITESGSLTEPDFLFELSSISKQIETVSEAKPRDPKPNRY